MISDTDPVRIMAYALHDTFGYNERWSNDDGARELIRELRRKGVVVMRSDEYMADVQASYNQGRDDVYDENF